MVTVRRLGPLLKPDSARVLLRNFAFREARVTKIIARVMTLTDAQVDELLAGVLADFKDRHHHLRRGCLARFEQVRHCHFLEETPSEARRTLIGAYFSQEYSIESAALFNPSMIWHPDQSEVPEGARRFILSLRSIGEGHLSSITFRSGLIHADCRIEMDAVSPYVTAPSILDDPYYDKALFQRKLQELGHSDGFGEAVLGKLEDQFTMTELRASLSATKASFSGRRKREHEVGRHPILTLAEANYELIFDPRSPLSERILFPHSPTETNGIEDARWVVLQDDDGSVQYVATYTAYDGRVVLPQLMATTDFLSFKVSTLNGPQVQDKGMALFPRRINGKYAMLSRQDGENIYLMYSDALHFWYVRELILKPQYPWEFVQLGNCGSPIETPEGWLVLSHGVGPMRKYAIGAFLFDLEDPSRVIGRLREPLLSPDTSEREGYVPNVVYTCGGQIHGENLILPYAMSDWASGFAAVNLRELLEELKANPGPPI